FQVNAVIDKNLNAISNAPIDHVRESSDPKKKIVAFEISPKISSYLLCLVLGDFKSTEERKSCGVPIRVWAPAGQEHLGHYALASACEIMSFLSDYFGIKFPAKKLDLIAIPDFAPGAMENLGAITFKDSLLLIDEKTGSTAARQSAFSVIAHEMAHQWFGDLVTNRWWDDLWLNEAFATWAATKTEDSLRPEWRIRSKAVLARNEAMSIDELASTRAIHAHVANPKQASEMFDSITYDKGSAVLRMLEVFVGEKVFQKGVHDYLDAHSFDNATSEDLWSAVAAAAKNVPVPQMMKTWILQAGFPLLNISGKNSGRSISIGQERYFVMPSAPADAAQWIVPVLARNLSPLKKSEETATPILLNSKDKSFDLPDEWQYAYLNAGASGFYRVQYDAPGTKKILDNFESLNCEERLAFIDDIESLVLKGRLPVESSLNLMLKLKNEKDSIVSSALASDFAQLRYFLDPDSEVAYRKLLEAYLAPLKTKLGWQEKKGEEETVKELRAVVLRELANYAQDAETIKEARALFAQYLKDRESVSADIISTVLSIVAYNGDENDYEKLKEAWKKASNPQEEKRFLYPLAAFRKPELVQKTLELALGPDTRSTDGVALLSALIGSKESNEQAWSYTRANWERLGKKFPPRFNKRIVGACASFDSLSKEKEMKEFFAAHPVEMGKAAVARMLENLHLSVLYRQRNEAKIRSWVKKQAQTL
ncbi:MAG: M1 family metallopeptidase, partial [Candidatus Obscuribacterales bacterium]|nr:M1 family metallopeptidase [Candidatus Obscuribacterales bacterium]